MDWLRKYADTNSDMIDMAKAAFRTTSDPDQAAWILPDGNMLTSTPKNAKDFSKPRHDSVAMIMEDSTTEGDIARKTFLDTGAIRVTPGNAEIAKEPTPEQLSALMRCIGGSTDYFLSIRDNGRPSLDQGMLSRLGVMRVIMEYYSIPDGGRGGARTAAIPRGFFEGLKPLIESMKTTFASVSRKASGVEEAADILDGQVSAMMWNGDAEVTPLDGDTEMNRFAVVDYSSDDDAFEVIVSKSTGNVEMVRVEMECGEDNNRSIECAAVALFGLRKLAATPSGIDKKVVRERRYRSGYILRDEIWSLNGEDTEMERQAYNPSGDYIGSSKEAYFLCTKKGIRPELASPEHSTCSIGYSTKDKRWYGWSHRAMCGFTIGDMLYEEGACEGNVPPRKCGKKPIETLQEAKQAAINFARSVS